MFTHKPLDESDVDIYSNPIESSSVKRMTFTIAKDLVLDSDIIDKCVAHMEDIKPYIVEDGGDVEVLGTRDGWLCITFSGNCNLCYSLPETIMFIEDYLCERVPEIRGIEVIIDG